MDLFDNSIICKDCKSEMIKEFTSKEGFKIRSVRCKGCNAVFNHPGDVERYNRFTKIRNKKFNVKLRMVGNSYCVSIPREIIQFEERFKMLEREMDRMMELCLEEPDKISLHFSRMLRRQNE